MMLLTFTTIAHADEGRYTMTSNQEDGDISYVWVLDSDFLDLGFFEFRILNFECSDFWSS